MRSLRRILLVEDSENDVALTLAAFEEARIANEVVVARDGSEALEVLFREGPFAGDASEPPAVVLLDLKLPKVDGHEVLARIKGDERLKTIPVVMLTSSAEESDLARSYDLGVNAYVVKPVSFEEFSKALREVGLFWAVLNLPPLRPSER